MNLALLVTLLITDSLLFAADPASDVKINRSMKADSINTTFFFAIDASGSMAGKLEDAIDGVEAFFSHPQLPRNYKAGALAFNGCSMAGESEANPAWLNFVMPISSNSGGAILDQLHRVKANGATDIVAAMNRSWAEMKRVGLCARLILRTDEMDTCHGPVTGLRNDPVMERAWGMVLGILQDIEKYCDKVQVNVITYAVGLKQTQLQSLAERSQTKIEGEFSVEQVKSAEEEARAYEKLLEQKTQTTDFTSTEAKAKQKAKQEEKKKQETPAEEVSAAAKEKQKLKEAEKKKQKQGGP